MRMTIVITAAISMYAVGSLLLIRFMWISARDERKELEDRLMAIISPEALITHKAYEDPEPGDVSYVDERREVELDDF
jgi:hypothetical protein